MTEVTLMKITIFNIFFKKSITRLEVYFYLARQLPDIYFVHKFYVYSGILPVNASLPVNAHLIFLQYNIGQGQMLLYVNQMTVHWHKMTDNLCNLSKCIALKQILSDVQLLIISIN